MAGKRKRGETEKEPASFEDEIFNIENREIPDGAWWWWFWLFFIDDPAKVEKPRQFMILWSTKNQEEINCNNKVIELDPGEGRDKLSGIVAAWYFDGQDMHHNFILGQSDLHFRDREVFSESPRETSFSVSDEERKVKVGDEFEFVARESGDHRFSDLTHYKNTFIGDKGYEMMKQNRLDLKSIINGEESHGSAYFQRVFVNAPAPSWYWGIFHFEDGGILTYYNPSFMGKSIKEDISFYDGERLYEIGDVEVERKGNRLPEFRVRGEEEGKEVDFNVKSYSHSSWNFKRKAFKFLPTRLEYNEYPARISDFRFEDKNSGEKITKDDLGKSVGNAEHTLGFMF